MRNSIVPDIIKFLLVFVGLPRFVILFLAADGFPLPAEWSIVHIASGVFGACMAGVEGFAIAYVFGALVSARGRQFNLLVALTALTCAALVGSLTPSIYARVMGLPVADVIGQTWALIWSFAVALMTFPAAAAVGIAQAVYVGDAQWREVAGQWQRKAVELTATVATQDAQMRDKVAELLKLIATLQTDIDDMSRRAATEHDEAAPVTRQMTRPARLDAIRATNAQRNGDGPMTAEQVVAAFGVSLRQAQRDVADAGD